MTKSKGKKKSNNKNHKQNNVATKLFSSRVSRILSDFLASDDPVYTFEANLSNPERAIVHERSKALGLASKSFGKGTNRCVSVYKRGNRKKKAMNGRVHSLNFSAESKGILMDLFRQYPPHEDDTVKQNIGKDVYKSKCRKDDIFSKPKMDSKKIANKMKSLTDRVKKFPKLKEIFEKKSKLPIAPFRNDIISTIAKHQVVLISGETGCGKTTQVPQFLLDYMWATGESCKIVCTQPRRISAMSVAERISDERGECIGETVGYKIRLESKGGRQSSILFCTNGILLRVLVSGGVNVSQSTRNTISELTHIIVDEIHERDQHSDFIIAILRDLLPAYPHLRLVLMSATLDAERFSEYFGGCPIIRVPGFTHPVKSFYLDDVLPMLNSVGKNHVNATSSAYHATLDDAIEMACSNEDFDPLLGLIYADGSPKALNYQHSSTGVSTLMIVAGKGRVSDVCTLLSLGAECRLQDASGSTALDWALRKEQPETAEIIKKHMQSTTDTSIEENLLEKYMSSINSEFIDINLIEKLLMKICSESTDGAILIFLPGWDDINKTRERLEDNPYFKDSSKFMILPLHSMVPSVEQKKVFIRPPPGCRKIVLSTNISETSVTIDDIVYVIDSGRMKEKSYDPYNNVSTLQSSWISQASAKQREGRAGRCQPGVCYHLYSKMKAISLQLFQVPEIKRMPIEELCLQVKMMNPNCKIEEFLKKALDPPLPETIKNAIAVLQDIGALSLDEQLTELGGKLGSLPVHPLISKMLFFAIMLNCLDPALTLACVADNKDPFILPMSPSEVKKVDAAKAELGSLYGGYSDQLAVIAAFDCWRKAKEMGVEGRFCSEYFVSRTSMCMLDGTRRLLKNELTRGGFISGNVSACSMNARDPGIVRAVLVAGLYPMVGKLQRSSNGKRCVVELASCNKVRLHLQSVVSKSSIKDSDEQPLVVFDEVVRGDSGLLTRHCTVITTLSLLLLASEIVVAPGNDHGDSGSDFDGDEDEMEVDKSSEQGGEIMSSPDNLVTVIVDRWLLYEATALQVAQIYCLRERLSSAILFKVANPRKVLPPELGASVYAIACLLSYDGISGISSSLESQHDNTPRSFLTSLIEPMPTRDERTYESAKLWARIGVQAEREEFEAEREEAEAQRVEAEARRVEANAQRVEADARRVEADARRKEAEARRKEAKAKRKEAQARPAEAGAKPNPVDPPGASPKASSSVTQAPEKQLSAAVESKASSSVTQAPEKQPLAPVESKLSRKHKKKVRRSESQAIQASSSVAAGAGSMRVDPPVPSSQASSQVMAGVGSMLVDSPAPSSQVGVGACQLPGPALKV